jgi:hypothetical protein
MSYCREDEPTVRGLYRTIRGAGVDVWLDVERLRPGQDWALEIERAVAQCALFLACLSRYSSNPESYVQLELNQALAIFQRIPQGEVYIIPLRLEECELPAPLKRLQWIDTFTPGGSQRVLDGIGHCMPVTSKGLSQGEWAVLMSIKGKPDVSWTAPLIEQAVRRSYPLEAAGTVENLQKLTAKGYLRFGEGGRVLPSGPAIDFWKRQRVYSRDRLQL